MIEKTLKFVRVKETKGTYKYDEVPNEGEPTVLRNVYCEKWFCRGAKELKITVAVVEEN